MKIFYITLLVLATLSGCAYNSTPIDSDNDGVFDTIDKCPNTPILDIVSSDGCSTKK